ncbi:MAG TPA: alpha-2-macroglobulin [Xanthobacteraceae bacterium]|jgi:uncharacterized protein YfaS (alpha-2-macroglobulin family)|nr:alpha-2-macroglobulin [Xanthobacteraceae bacterium]
MFALLRVTFAVALFALSGVSAYCADKPFSRDDLSDAALRLEAEIKRDAAPVTKSPAALRRDADAALQKRDYRASLVALGKLVSVSPDNSANWLRLAKTVLLLRPANDRERAMFQERAATAAYIAYQRSNNADEEADSLVLIGRSYADRKVWRPALDALRESLERRDVPAIRTLYETYRDAHGFRLLDYAVDSDAASPRVCFQFSEDLLGKRVDFTPFVSMAGVDRPALTAEARQLCVEGLKHGERYEISLRAGLPSAVNETLTKTANYTIYVRDRKPFVRFSTRAYVLPRTGQQGIPVISVNTKAIDVAVYRIGDRSLIDTVLGYDFQRSLDRYQIERLADTRGEKIWKGQLSAESPLNDEVTTAFPIENTVGDLQPGVYIMTAQPAEALTDDYGAVATQWFIVSDLGLTAYSAPDGIHAFVHSLASAKPLQKVDIKLMSRSNEILATRPTNGVGHVQFESGLARGESGMAPALLIASTADGDYAFLSLKSPAFDLTDRGVAGRKAPGALDAFVVTERGVYRSDETVHITTLLRDAKGVAVGDTPVTLVVERPDGMEYRRAIVADGGIGGRSLDVALDGGVASGTWRVRAFTDPKQPAIGETTFMVEDYVPERLEFDLTAKTPTLSTTSPAELTVDGRYLYGAPAANLDLEGELVIAPTNERPGFSGYQFGLTDEQVETKRVTLDDLPSTDAAGKATVLVSIDELPSDERLFSAQAIIRLAESGGRAVERKIDLAVTPSGPMIGVKPLFTGSALSQGANAGFDVVLVGADGKPLTQKGLRYELLKVDSRYQWYRQDNAWQYEPIKTTKRVADGTLDMTADAPAHLSLPVAWGRYRLQVSSPEPDGPATSIAFDAGYYAEAGADTPDRLEVALDKPEYKRGDTMTVAVTARTAGTLTVNVFGDGLLQSISRDVREGTTKIPLGVGRDWGGGAYVVATLLRSLDEKQKRMPGRAIGVQWFGIEHAAHTLSVSMTPPAQMRPQTALHVPMKVAGLAADEDARIVVAAVDVGILNLTNYKPPAPEDYYLGQRKLATDIRDIYGQLIDGMQGTRGQVRSGGDIASAELQGSPPAQAPLALYSGVVHVQPDGTAAVDFDIPAFAGTVRLMAMAWTKDKVGHGVQDVIVRDPIVVTATLPRFLRTGDRGTLNLAIDNVDGAAGDYHLAVTSDGIVKTGEGADKNVHLDAKQHDQWTVPVSASEAGTSTIRVALSGPGGLALERSYTLATLPATQTLTRRTVQSIAKGESITLSDDLFADFVPGTGAVSFSANISTALDVASLLRALDRYPYGCSEQITSRALPLLYVNDIADQAHMALDQDADKRIRESIARLLARQASNGSFGLWNDDSGDVWLDSYITEFLTRARERGFPVEETAFKLALDRLKNYVGNVGDPKNGGRDLAYALYVLARNATAPIGDLRYIADTKLDAIDTPIAKAQIAAALGMVGDRTRAQRVYGAAIAAIATKKDSLSRPDFGSVLRDSAAVAALAGEGNAPQPMLINALQRVDAARAETQATSTQENAWLVLAARAMAKDADKILLDVNGEKRPGAVYRTLTASEVKATPLKVANDGDGPVQAVVSVSGAPLIPEPAAEQGFKIERKFYSLDGKETDPSQAKQNQRFVVVLRMTEPIPQYGRIVVADNLPAGFEIDNPKLVSSGDTGTLSWIQDAVAPISSTFKDDRFVAAFDRKANDRPVFTVAYVVRAVTRGHFVLPQAKVEDMYRPERYGRTATGTIEVTDGS